MNDDALVLVRVVLLDELELLAHAAEAEPALSADHHGKTEREPGGPGDPADGM